MSRICKVTNKKTIVGNNVSRSNRKTKRRFLPNLQIHKFFIKSKKKWISLKISTFGLRLIDKKGIDFILNKKIK